MPDPISTSKPAPAPAPTPAPTPTASKPAASASASASATPAAPANQDKSKFDSAPPKPSTVPPPLPNEAPVPAKGSGFELFGLKPLDAIADAGRAVSGAGDAVSKFFGDAIHQYEETPSQAEVSRGASEQALIGWAQSSLGKDNPITQGLSTAAQFGHEVDRQARHFGGGVAQSVLDIPGSALQLVGGAMQLADPKVRESAGNTISSIAQDPGAAASRIAGAVVDQVKQDPAHAAGYVVGTVATMLIGGAGAASDGAKAAEVTNGAADLTRTAELGEDAAKGLSLAERAANAAKDLKPLLSGDEYASLLARQHAGEILDLKNVVRPGIAAWDDKKAALTMLQGSGRWEQVPMDGFMDVFVPVGQQLPADAVKVGEPVSGDVVRAANLLSSRGAAGENPELVDMLTQGKTYQRVLVPRAETVSSMSTATRANMKALQGIQQWAGANGGADELAKALASPAYANASVIDQGQRLAAAAAAQERGLPAVIEALSHP